MITADNLKKVLEELHYVKSKKKEIYVKEFPDFDCIIKVDFGNKKITYPENKGMVIHRKTTCNFSENENFVVLECITSLLNKGYKPEHIELEKPMPGGHDDTGGYCDVLVKDNQKKTFLLIECKKEDEFDKYWKKTMADGGQLFRYFNSYRQAQALCMYTSDLSDDGKIKRSTNIISMLDNEDYLLTDAALKSFKQVQADNGDKEDYFRVWKETYGQDFATRGIFEEDINAYTIGKLKYGVGDLDEVDNDAIQKKYHEFATILRQHNVGSHENAFDKLVNLFLAKIVDETLNPKELQFRWKGAAYDDYYSLQDRLQKLYKEGMEKFLGEEVTYIDQKEISDAFYLFKEDPDATRNKVLEYFRQLKFYTNSDFAFLDVHNEDLFYQNAVILKKIVKMLEDIKLKTREQNQFLGDLFEGFLDDGVKQSEGQFFTPLPIVKFLVSSLPLEQIIRDHEEVPLAIDYACGAGHFLTEYASCIKRYVERYKAIPVSEYYKGIYGIEKEYRLSKVSKVSAFMYGQDDIQIIYGDALAENAKVADQKFSVLISNPPYSVKGFLETLTDEERSQYTLMNAVSDISKNNSIETFFVERAKQLLLGGGVAAIVLPSSVLSNGNIYTSCREILLKYFDLIAIAELGSGTFGKTGTNTATFFLRRKGANPDLAEHFENRVNAWFDGDTTKDVVFEDGDNIEQYCGHCGIDAAEYRQWINGGKFPQAEIFFAYVKKAKTSVRYKNIQKKKVTKKYSEEDKANELETYLQGFIKGIEKEKLYYYLLARHQSCQVVILKSPSDHKEDKNRKLMKEFLGYEWSGAKGSEGIKYLGVSVSKENEDDVIVNNKGIKSIKTPLFDPNDYDNDRKLNTIIRNNFENGYADIPNELKAYADTYDLVDMLDFSRVDFDKAIRTSGISKEKFMLKSKYSVKTLDKLAAISRGASPRPIEVYLTEDKKGIPWIKIGDAAAGEKYITKTAQRITKEGAQKSKSVFPGDFILSNSMSVGRPYILKIKGCIHDGWLLLSHISDDVNKEYLYYVLSSEVIQSQLRDHARGGVVKNLNIARVSTIQIPVPPMNVQDQIVSECRKMEGESRRAFTHNKKIKQQMEEQMKNLSAERKALSEIAPYTTVRIGFDEINASSYVTTDNMLPDFEGCKEFEGSTSADKVIEYKEGDILVSNIRPYLRKIWIADKNGGCSPDVLVFRVKDKKKVLPEFVYYSMRRDAFFDWAMSDVKGMKMPRGKKETISAYQIAIPSIEEQTDIVKKMCKLKKQMEKNNEIIKDCEEKREEIVQRNIK
ncbi:MAG: N-6 DNA methylase [Lachnospiraceae bacterium]|nr:N-6 DNA methylase [Lachnospiraceae bacterium]